VFFLCRKPATSTEDDVAPEGQALLARLKHVQREQHLNGTVAGSVSATDRLMKELREIYRSEHYKSGALFHPLVSHPHEILFRLLHHRAGQRQSLRLEYQAEKVGCHLDCALAHFNRCFRVDPDSPLAQDLVTLKKKENQDYILLNLLFKDNFPFEPPFVRLVSPTVSNGFVLGGGAICMELLTKQV
jgi:ubiquitin-conjugating enzyme E2 Q